MRITNRMITNIPIKFDSLSGETVDMKLAVPGTERTEEQIKDAQEGKHISPPLASSSSSDINARIGEDRSSIDIIPLAPYREGVTARISAIYTNEDGTIVTVGPLHVVTTAKTDIPSGHFDTLNVTTRPFDDTSEEESNLGIAQAVAEETKAAVEKAKLALEAAKQDREDAKAALKEAEAAAKAKQEADAKAEATRVASDEKAAIDAKAAADKAAIDEAAAAAPVVEDPAPVVAPVADPAPVVEPTPVVEPAPSEEQPFGRFMDKLTGQDKKAEDKKAADKKADDKKADDKKADDKKADDKDDDKDDDKPSFTMKGFVKGTVTGTVEEDEK